MTAPRPRDRSVELLAIVALAVVAIAASGGGVSCRREPPVAAVPVLPAPPAASAPAVPAGPDELQQLSEQLAFVRLSRLHCGGPWEMHQELESTPESEACEAVLSPAWLKDSEFVEQRGSACEWHGGSSCRAAALDAARAELPRVRALALLARLVSR